MSMNDPKAKEIAGTLDYMSPEQRAGGEIDARSDLYACGVILYELLTGERPAGTDLPSDLNKSVPKHLDDAFKRSYARLEKRFPSTNEFAGALAEPTRARVATPILSRAGDALAGPLARVTALCPGCRKPIDANDQFCMHCGVQLVTTVRRCPRCGAYPDSSDRFCIFCGEGLPAVQESVA